MRGRDQPTSVNGSACVLKLKLLTTKPNLLQFNLPVSLSAYRGIRELALVGGVINTTEGSLSSVFLGLSHAESKHGLVDETLVHKIVEGWDHVGNSNGVVSEPKDTVKSGYQVSKRGETSEIKRGDPLAKSEGKTWLLSSLSEVHTFHCEVTHVENVIRHEAFHRTRTIVDFNTSSVVLVS